MQRRHPASPPQLPLNLSPDLTTGNCFLKKKKKLFQHLILFFIVYKRSKIASCIFISLLHFNIFYTDLSRFNFFLTHLDFFDTTMKKKHVFINVLISFKSSVVESHIKAQISTLYNLTLISFCIPLRFPPLLVNQSQNQVHRNPLPPLLD